MDADGPGVKFQSSSIIIRISNVFSCFPLQKGGNDVRYGIHI